MAPASHRTEGREMSSTTTELIELKGAVAWVWLNRPRRLNAIDEATLDALQSAFDEAARSETIKAVVLAGRGPAFCAGFDIQWMVNLDGAAVVGGMDHTCAVFNAIEACPKPVIAAVHGAAMGGGLLLALAADYILAAETAKFGAPEVKIAMFPALQLVPKLARAVGVSTAKRMLLAGDPLDAAEAHRIGLVERVVAEGLLLSEAEGLAEQLAALPSTVVQLCKAAFTAADRPGYADWEKAQFATCWELPERKAAMRGFLKA